MRAAITLALLVAGVAFAQVPPSKGGTFTGGTVPSATTFASTVTFNVGAIVTGSIAISAGDVKIASGRKFCLVADCSLYLSTDGTYLIGQGSGGGGFQAAGNFNATGGANFQLSGGKFYQVDGNSPWSANTVLQDAATATTAAFRLFSENTLSTDRPYLQLNNNGTVVAQFRVSGLLRFDATDSSGTPGAATINKPSGQAAIAASASSVVITDNVVSSTSVVTAVLQATDGTCTSIKSVVPGSGTFTVNVNAACTGATKIGFVVFN